MRRTILALATCLALPLALTAQENGGEEPAAAASVPSPESHFGFEPGTEGRLASWEALVGYYDELAESSDRVDVRRLGETTLGNPFLLVTISSPENLANRERLAEVSRSLADPRGLSDDEIAELVAEGRSVVAVTAGLHSTEVAATQMAAGLAHRLATAEDERTLRILDETVFLLFPCFNPDGTEMVVDWTERTRGTRFEGSRVPDLYHHYAGHDNNRDAYMLNLAESRMFADVVYHEWIPQMYLDVHQMGSYGARLYIPPYEDPINPEVDPLVWMEHELVGANMEMALERAGIHGVVTGAPYTGWWFPSFHMVTNHHNIAGMLTETASTRMAWPLYIHPHQLEAEGRKHAVYEPMQLFPHPWEGGWWTPEEMVRQQEVSTYALLSTAAENRELLLENMAFKARRTIERGRTDPPAAFVIPAGQHDPLTVEALIGRLMANGIEVHRTERDVIHEGRSYRSGDYVVSTAQPNGVLVRSLLGEAHYPDDARTRRADGTILRPYDMSNFVLAEQMGVEAVPVETPLEDGLTLLERPPERRGEIVGTGSAGWIVSHAPNAAFRLTNRVLADGGEAWWLREPIEAGGRSLGSGALWVPADDLSGDRARELAATTGVDLHAASSTPSGPAYRLRPLRLGLYRRYLGGNMDEGWTRLLFDRWDFPYRRVEADDIRAGTLGDLDVLLVPSDDLEALEGEGDVSPPGEGEPDEYPEVFLPPEYTEGMDEEAFDAIRSFVRGGGTLVLLDQAWELATEKLGVPIRNVVADLPDTTYMSPGSNLRVLYDRSHPLAYGMPAEGLLLNWSSPVFEVERSSFNERIAAPVTYPEAEILKSGWLIGEERIAERAAAVDVEYGDGRIIIIGARPQHRAQTHGTFKLLFNALYYGTAEETRLD